MTPEDNIIGALVRRRRLEAGLTLEELGERAQVSPRTVGNLERGAIRGPHPTTLRAIADALALNGEDRRNIEAAARALRRAQSRSASRPVRPSLPIEFVGRQAELDQVAEVHRRPGTPGLVRTVLVTGGPGLGKTTLALHAGDVLSEDLPDGVHFIDLQGLDEHPLTAAQVCRRVLRAVGADDKQVPTVWDYLLSAARSALSERRAMFVLDNAANADQYDPLVTIGARSTLVITSRRPLKGDTAVRLQPMDRASSINLLRAGLGDRVDQDITGDLGELAEMCSDTPLALSLAARRLATRRQWSVPFMVDRLRHARAPLDVLAQDGERMDAVVDLSYRQLTSDAAQVLRRMSLVVGSEASYPMLSLVAGLPEDHVDVALEELVEAGLVEARGNARFGTHDLIRAFARVRLGSADPPDEVARAEGRLADWLLDNLTEVGRVYTPIDQQDEKATEATFAQPADAQEWLRTERRTWFWAVAYLARTNQHRRVLDAAGATRFLTYRHSGWPEWQTVWELALRSAVAMADRLAEAMAHLALASIHGNGLVDGDRALHHSEQALSIGLESGDVAIQADALYAMADVHSDIPGESGTALTEATRAREAYEAIGNGYKQTETTSMIAYILSDLGRHEESVREYDALLDLLDEQGRDGRSPTDSSRIVALSNMGLPLTELGRLDDAMMVAHKAMELADETGYHDFSAFSRRRMAIVRLRMSDRQGARAWFDDALRVCSEHQLSYPAQAIARTVAELGPPIIDVQHGQLSARIADIRQQLDAVLGPA